jgi:hypothetical protein
MISDVKEWGRSMEDHMQIIYKEKRNSSGLIREGEIVLYISSRLPLAEQRRHIKILTGKLQAKLAQAQVTSDALRQAGLPAGLTPSPVCDDTALAAWAAQINQDYYRFEMGKVRFRPQESRWGSCSGRTRNLQISHRLRGGPHELLEYVLIHEIAHLGELNHSDRFWRLVERGCPDYRERRRLLRRYEAYLQAQLVGTVPPGTSGL